MLDIGVSLGYTYTKLKINRNGTKQMTTITYKTNSKTTTLELKEIGNTLYVKGNLNRAISINRKGAYTTVISHTTSPKYNKFSGRYEETTTSRTIGQLVEFKY